MSKFGKKPAEGESEKRPKKVTVCDIRIQDTKQGKKTKIQFAKDITIQYKGETLDLGEYNSFFLKDRNELEADLTFLVDKDFMTEEQANADVDHYEKKNITHVLKVEL